MKGKALTEPPKVLNVSTCTVSLLAEDVGLLMKLAIYLTAYTVFPW
jgi:hypothetical protein